MRSTCNYTQRVLFFFFSLLLTRFLFWEVIKFNFPQEEGKMIFVLIEIV